jgi:ABC-type multidrug transport system fused ATPase/permease subunit
MSKLALNWLFISFFSCIKNIEDGIGDKIGLLIRGISMFITTFAIAFVVNWKISLVMLLIAPICCLNMSFMARLISRSSKKQLKSNETAGALLQEAVMNVKTVQSCNGQEEMVEKLEKQQNMYRIHGIMAYFWVRFYLNRHLN